MGSTNVQLFYTASRKLFQTTIIGCLLGVPLIWYVMSEWLHSFAEHTNIGLWEFAIALFISVVFSLATVSGYTLKVIRANPVKYLRED
jgi:putative ABC transport system permease protein